MAERPLDRIHIRDLRGRCVLGVYPDERRETQDVVVNVTLYGDLRKAGETDAIEDTVNYKTVKKEVLGMLEDSECMLLERLAERIAEIGLRPDRVQRVDVCVDKPGALRFARSVAIEITRSKG